MALAGCGGGNESTPDETVRTYFEALADGDGAKACGQLTGEAKREAVDALNAQLPEIASTNCDDAISELAKGLGEDEKSKLRDAKLEEPSVKGNSATVKISGATELAELEKSGGAWLISGGLFESAGGSVGSEPSAPETPADPSADDETAEETANRVLSQFKDLGFQRAFADADTLAVAVKAGTTESQAANLCDHGARAVAAKGVTKVVVIPPDQSELASCVPGG